MLRTQFFNCRQEPNQSLRSFSLWLRELFFRLKHKEDNGLEKLAEATIASACPVAEVKVDDVDVKCLVDTGSQVTLFSENLCKELFESKQTHNGNLPWLTLRAANGLNIPYVTYMVADFIVGG